MPVFNNILAGASGATSEAAAFQIDRSLRFSQGDQAYLNRTPSSAGNRRTYTLSFWVKKVKISDETFILAAYLSDSSGRDGFRFENDNTFRVFFDSATEGDLITSQVFRDPSAWYHFVVAVDTTQSTASNRVKIYLNGTQITNFSTETYPTQNYQSDVNNTYLHRIGADVQALNNNLEGYLAEFHLVDGQALAASDFGEFDSNNVWQAKAYSGTYGTNGFRLAFADNSSNSALGNDSSGNDNDWTVNNLSVASGAGNDSLIDTPTNYTSASGNNGGNYCTLNPLASDSPLLNGNLESDGASGAWKFGIGTIAFPKSGKWYFEVEATAYSGNFGIAKLLSSSQINATIRDSGESTAVWYAFDGKVWSRYSGQGSTTSVQTGLATFNNGDVVGFGVNVDDEEVKFYVNGSLQYTYSLPTQIAADLTAGKLFPIVDTYGGVNAICNFGQRPFSISSVPTGHVSLCTQNLADPTIADGSTAMDIVTYSGTGTTQSITGLAFSPDFVWLKCRNAAKTHRLYDAVRGATKVLQSDTTDAEVTDSSGLTSFNSDGFTLGGSGGHNGSSDTMVSWAWDAGTSNTTVATDANGTGLPGAECVYRANTTNGFSIVRVASPTATEARVHGLGAKPDLIICKSTASSDSWHTYHSSLGYTKYINLNSSGAASTSDQFGSQEPTSTYFYVKSNTGSGANKSGGMIYYIWTAIEGYSAFGSYEGNGSSDGPFIYTGFKVAWLLIKNADTSNETWTIHDSTRDVDNPAEHRLLPNSSGAESTGTSARFKDLLSNGFKIRGTSGEQNTSGDTYIYAAFAEHPFKSARAR